MRNIKYLLLILLFCFCLNVKAVDDCTSNEIKRLKELANKVEFKTNYKIEESEENGKYAIYYIKTLNFNDDLKLFYREYSNETYIPITVSELEQMYFQNIKKVEFKIYSYTNNLCTDRSLRNIIIELPSYNLWYEANKDKCNKYPEFKYCKELMNIDNDNLDKINKQFEEYTKENISSNDNDSNNFVLRLIIFVISSLCLVGSLVLMYIIFIKKNKKESI